jgi:hypothetical protein
MLRYIYIYIYIYISARVLCVYILCGIAQLDVGYVIVCSAKRTRAFSRVSWPDLGGQGCYKSIPKESSPVKNGVSMFPRSRQVVNRSLIGKVQ